jgi:hypothetical protein
MATSHPTPDGFNRRPRRGRVFRTTFNVVGLGAVVTAPIAAVSLWLLLTDPVLAGAVAERGSLLPVVKTLVIAVGKAIATVLTYM